MPRTKAEVEAYLTKHDLRKKMEEALNKVVEDMPDDPCGTLAKLLSGSGPAPTYPRANTLLPSPAAILHAPVLL